MTALPVLERACAGCIMCCIAPSVAELNKPAWTMCQHAKPGHGCSIYPDRPPSCRAFTCAWLQGAIPMDFRPSVVRVVFWTPVADKPLLHVQVDPHRPDALWQGKLGRWVYGWLRDRGPIVVYIGHQEPFVLTQKGRVKMTRNEKGGWSATVPAP